MPLASLRTWLTDRRLTRLKTPLGVLTTLGVLSLLCGLFVHSRGFVAAAAVAAVAVLGWLWPWASLQAVEARIRLEPRPAGRRRRGREGDPVRVTILIRNWMPWSVYGLSLRGGFESEWKEEPREGNRIVSVAVVPGRATVEIEWEFTPELRGWYPRESLRVACAFPFGLWTATRPVTAESPLLVWPRALEVGPLPNCGHRVHACGSIPRDVDGGHGDLMGVRPYRRGDSLRRVHWAQTARCDRLIVCEHQSHATLAVSVAPDLDLAIHTAGPQGSLENAIRATVGVVEQALAARAETSTWVAGRHFDLHRDARAYERWLDALSQYDAGPATSCVQRNETNDEEPKPAHHSAHSRAQKQRRNESNGLRVIVTSPAGRARAFATDKGSPTSNRWYVVLSDGRTEWCAEGRRRSTANTL